MSKNHRIYLTHFGCSFVLALSLGIAICSGQTPPPGPVPSVGLSVNGKPVPQTIQGEALIFSAVLFHPNIFGKSVTPLVINAQNGSWGNTVRIAVTDSTGAAVTWPIHLAGAPPGALTLDAEQTGLLNWILSAADAQNIAPGTYQVLAILDTTASAGSTGWSGTTSSDVVSLQITAPTQPTPAQVQQQMTSQALTDHFLGNDAQALADLDQLLTQFPTSVEAMAFKGRLLADLGRSKEALQSYEQALAAFYAQVGLDPEEPPAELLRPIAVLRNVVYGGPGGGGGSPSTSILASVPALTFSPSDQSVTLTATVSNPNVPVNGGTVTFSLAGLGNPVTSTPVSQGSASVAFVVLGGTHAGTYAVKATYSGADMFGSSVDSSELLTINKATPVITWSPPASVPAGTALSPTQLNATANVPGTFVYNPPAGTVLPPGTTQTLGVTFTPADSTDYNSVTATVSLAVLAGSYSGSISPSSATVAVGSSKSFNVTITSSSFAGIVTLGCAKPPSGISCLFMPSQVTLNSNGNASTVLTVSVATKPAAAYVSRSSPNWRPGQFMLLVLLVICILPLMFFVPFRSSFQNAYSGRRLTAVVYTFVILLISSVYLISCSGLTDRGTGNGGGSPQVKVSLTIQGNSGSTTATLGTVTITVP